MYRVLGDDFSGIFKNEIISYFNYLRLLLGDEPDLKIGKKDTFNIIVTRFERPPIPQTFVDVFSSETG